MERSTTNALPDIADVTDITNCLFACCLSADTCTSRCQVRVGSSRLNPVGHFTRWLKPFRLSLPLSGTNDEYYQVASSCNRMTILQICSMTLGLG